MSLEPRFEGDGDKERERERKKESARISKHVSANNGVITVSTGRLQRWQHRHVPL